MLRGLLSGFDGQLVRFLVGLEEHEYHERDQSKRRYGSDNIHIAGEEHAELIYDQSDRICEQALIPDCEPSPLCIVHLTLDCTDGCEAGSAEKVKDEEGVSGKSGEGACEVLIYACVAAAVKDTESTDDVFLLR